MAKRGGATKGAAGGRTRAAGECSFCGRALEECSCGARRDGTGKAYDARYRQEARAAGVALEAEQAATVAHVALHCGQGAALVAARLLRDGHAERDVLAVAATMAAGARPAPEPRQAPRAAALPTRAARRDAARTPWTARIAALWTMVAALVLCAADDGWTMLLGYGGAVLLPALAALAVRRDAVAVAVRAQVGGTGRHGRVAARSVYTAPALALAGWAAAVGLWVLSVR